MTVRIGQQYQTFVYSKAGALTVVAGTIPIYLDEAYVIDQVRASVGTAPIGNSIIIDVNKNGTTIFTTQARRPTITANTAINSAAIEVSSLAAGDRLTVDIDQVGSSVAGSDLTVNIRLRRA